MLNIFSHDHIIAVINHQSCQVNYAIASAMVNDRMSSVYTLTLSQWPQELERDVWTDPSGSLYRMNESHLYYGDDARF